MCIACLRAIQVGYLKYFKYTCRAIQQQVGRGECNEALKTAMEEAVDRYPGLTDWFLKLAEKLLNKPPPSPSPPSAPGLPLCKYNILVLGHSHRLR